MIRTIAAALAAFVLVSFGVRAEETKPADTKPAKAEKKAHKKAKKAKKDAAAKTETAPAPAK